MLQVMGVEAPAPTCGLTEWGTKAVNLFESAEFKADAIRYSGVFGLRSGAVVVELQRVAAHPNLSFDFTNGVSVPHLWTALRRVSHPKTSNRM